MKNKQCKKRKPNISQTNKNKTKQTHNTFSIELTLITEQKGF